MVINTPFNDSFYHFYLNYKISNLIPKGTFKMGDFELKFNPKKTLVFQIGEEVSGPLKKFGIGDKLMITFLMEE